MIGCMPLPAYMYTILGCACVAAWLFILFVEYKIITAVLKCPDLKADWIIVLGAQVKGTVITDSLRRRLDRAVSYLTEFPEIKVIVSGGQGPGEEIAEADAMAGYLEKQGISADRIYREDRSTSTRENLRFCRQYLDAENGRIGIVTNGFHIYRALLLARQEGYSDPFGLPASSNPVFQLNYLAREFFAVVYIWLKGGRA